MSADLFALHSSHPGAACCCPTLHMVSILALGRWMHFPAVVDDFGSLVIVGGPL